MHFCGHRELDSVTQSLPEYSSWSDNRSQASGSEKLERMLQKKPKIQTSFISELVNQLSHPGTLMSALRLLRHQEPGPKLQRYILGPSLGGIPMCRNRNGQIGQASPDMAAV